METSNPTSHASFKVCISGRCAKLLIIMKFLHKMLEVYALNGGYFNMSAFECVDFNNLWMWMGVGYQI
jgi:hypothetical protein